MAIKLIAETFAKLEGTTNSTPKHRKIDETDAESSASSNNQNNEPNYPFLILA